jgi:hypothetical protein
MSDQQAGHNGGIAGIGLAVVRSLGQQPVLFAFLLVNVALLAIVFASVKEQRSQTHEIVRFMLEHCVSKT